MLETIEITVSTNTPTTKYMSTLYNGKYQAYMSVAAAATKVAGA
jgi:hypothetical protein